MINFRKERKMDIRKVKNVEVNKALKLAWEVFLDFEAFGYERSGVEEFRIFLDCRELINTLEFYGAYEKDEIIGMIAVQDKQHICMFFVKRIKQRQGIGRALLEKVLENGNLNEIMANVPPYSLVAYKKLGFKVLSKEQNINGITFIPMKYNKGNFSTKVINCRDKELTLGEKTLIMGILNITPDSFSDGGDYFSVERAVEHAKKMIADGADIIDIGGQSTRPGYTPISEDEEIARIVPVIKKVVELGAIVSVDTYKSRVAEAAFEAGAHILNDIKGLQYDRGDMAKLVKKYDVAVVVMHGQKSKNNGEDIIDSIKNFFKRSFEITDRFNISRSKVILDPGIGFEKGKEENIEILSRLDEIKQLGNLLLGTSRKRFIGTILNDLPPKERVEGTIATTVLGIQKGVDIVRVHDVLENKRAASVADEIVRRY